MFEQRMTLLTLGVESVERAQAFYEALGWRASAASQAGEIAFFQNGSSAIALYPQGALSGDLGIDGPPRAGGVTLAYNTRSRDEVDALMRHVEAAGARILQPAHETPWGGYAGYFSDPDGHPWEVTFAPMFELTTDGSIPLP